MKLFFSLAFIILATASDLPDENEIDFNKVKILQSNIIMQPLNVVDPNTAIANGRKIKARIINGVTATSIIQFPYQVKLLLRSSTEGTKEDPVFKNCGATIIGREWLLTAAHCLEDVLEGYAYVGCVNIADKNVKRRSGTCRKIFITPNRYFRHRKYISNDADGTKYDIALIRLRRPLRFSDSVKKIELNKNRNITIGQTVVVSGYGTTETGNLSDQLKFTSSKIMDPTACKEVFEQVDETVLCVEASTLTSDCQGDSGGPLTMNKNGNVTLIGVVSYGGPTCLNYPGVYTRVSSYLNWICNITGIGNCHKRWRHRRFH